MRLIFLVKNLEFRGFSAARPDARSLHRMSTGIPDLESTDEKPI